LEDQYLPSMKNTLKETKETLARQTDPKMEKRRQVVAIWNKEITFTAELRVGIDKSAYVRVVRTKTGTRS